MFITNKREFSKEWIAAQNEHLILDIEGKWDFYNNHELTIEKRKANRISYFVDELVKRELSKVPQCEIVADYLMSLNRVERRLFAMEFFEHYAKHQDKVKDFLSRRHIFHTFHDASCLMLYYISSLPEDKLDEFLKITGEIYLYKTINHQKKLIVIGTTKNYSRFKFGYIERTEPYSKEDVNYYETLIKNLGWFTSHTFARTHTKEYPTQSDTDN